MVGLAIMSQAFQMKGIRCLKDHQVRQGQKHLTGQLCRRGNRRFRRNRNGRATYKAESKEHGGNTLQKGGAGAAQAV